MKQILLCRHAKSSWKNPELVDRDRPLAKRGKRDAPLMGRELSRRGVSVDRILCSPAKRTRKTARKIARELDFPRRDIVLVEEIYGADSGMLLQLIQAQKKKYHHLMLVGHNLAITDLANALGDLDIANVPTCGVVGFSFPVQRWRDVWPGNGTPLFFLYPKLLALHSD
ncbi:SixA phosphatase family protein [Desulfolithobacter sp.]